jgi:hypothetical protein
VVAARVAALAWLALLVVGDHDLVVQYASSPLRSRLDNGIVAAARTT